MAQSTILSHIKIYEFLYLWYYSEITVKIQVMDGSDWLFKLYFSKILKMCSIFSFEAKTSLSFLLSSTLVYGHATFIFFFAFARVNTETAKHSKNNARDDPIVRKHLSYKLVPYDTQINAKMSPEHKTHVLTMLYVTPYLFHIFLFILACVERGFFQYHLLPTKNNRQGGDYNTGAMRKPKRFYLPSIY